MVWKTIGHVYRVVGTIGIVVAAAGFCVRLMAGAPAAPENRAADTATPALKFGRLEVRIDKWSEARGKYVETRPVTMNWERISRAGMGADWPLNVDEAYVGCSKELPSFSVLVVVDGEPWALNGSTKGWARGGMYTLEIAGANKTVRVTDQPEDWWAVDPDLVIGGKMGRKYIGPLFRVVERIGCLLPTR